MQSLGDGMPGLSSPNPENKLFIGGAPAGTDENTLQQVILQPVAMRGMPTPFAAPRASIRSFFPPHARARRSSPSMER